MSARFVLLLLLVFLAPVCLRAQAAESAAREKEEYAVYSVIIPEIYHKDEGGILIIANPTWRYPSEIARKDFRFTLPGPILSQETLDDFQTRNKTDRWFERKFALDFAYELVDIRTIKKLIGDDPWSDWKEVFKKYPASHGFLSYSRVGFNQQMNQALVYGGWKCPGLCGHWEFLLLEKKSGAWNVVNRANDLVS